jgi:hypothetical protein
VSGTRAMFWWSLSGIGTSVGHVALLPYMIRYIVLARDLTLGVSNPLQPFLVVRVA